MLKHLIACSLLVAVSHLYVAQAEAFRWGGPKLVFHTFGFDALADSPGIDVLDYRYGTSKAPGASFPDWIKRDVGRAYRTMTSGPMIVGSELYVQWRINATGEILEDLVDLDGLRASGRMSKDIEGHTIYFVVNDRQLEVYDVSPNSRDPKTPPIGPGLFDRYEVTKVYP